MIAVILIWQDAAPLHHLVHQHGQFSLQVSEDVAAAGLPEFLEEDLSPIGRKVLWCGRVLVAREAKVSTIDDEIDIFGRTVE